MTNLILKNKEIDKYGRVAFNEDGLVALLKQRKDISESKVLNGDWVQTYQKSCDYTQETYTALKVLEDIDTSIEEFDSKRQHTWFIPDLYKSMDVFEYLLSKCSTQEQMERVAEEWILYSDRDLVSLLKLMIYLIQVFRDNGIVWGVGRGSSVSSYILYLIGVHKIDSMKYNLEISEFLK